MNPSNNVTKLFTTEDTEDTEAQSFFVRDSISVSSVSSVVERLSLLESLPRAY
jgi:hypothetical protein